MEMLTVGGFLSSFLIVFINLYFHGSSILSLLNFPALSIVVGGTCAAISIQTPITVLTRAYHILPWIFFPPTYHFEKLISQVTQWTRISRKNGLLRIENQFKKVRDPFIKLGLDLLLSGSKKEIVTEVLENRIDTIEDIDITAANVFESMGSYSPTLGVLGAVMGLIQAMQKLTDPSSLGQGIALAFIATIYGVGFANFILIPISNKLKIYIYDRTRFYEMYITGINSLMNGDHPDVVEMKMKSFIASK